MSMSSRSGRGIGPGEQIALSGSHAQLAHHAQLAGRLEALGITRRPSGRRGRASSAARREMSRARRPPGRGDRSILTMSKRNWLSSRRPALPAPTSSAAMRRPRALQRNQVDLQAGRVLDLLALGQLDDDASGIDAVASEDREQCVGREMRRLNRARRDVDRQQLIARHRSGRRRRQRAGRPCRARLSGHRSPRP